MWQVMFFDSNGTQGLLGAWFRHESTAREYAEALKDNAGEYSLYYVRAEDVQPQGWEWVEV